MSGVGGRSIRPDAAAKVQGKQPYVGDLHPPGMLHAAILASDQAPARILRLDVAAARQVEGVVAVMTAADLGDKNHIGIIFDDQPLLVDTEIRMVGERLALVVAETRAACQAGLEAMELETEPLPGVYDAEHALDPDAPQVHPDGNLIRTFVVDRGDLASARETAEVVVEETYRIGGQEHAYLEPQGCLAAPAPTGGMWIYSSTQCPFYVRGAVAKVLDLPLAEVRVLQTPTGGGFGGKEDYPNEIAACAALLAQQTGRPVRLLLPRELDFQASTKRHRMTVHHKLYADAKGHIIGVDAEVLVDAGAYVGMSTVVSERANTSLVGPYAVDNVRIRTQVLRTNNLFGGPFRGFGAPQVTVVHECQMDRLARQVGLAPLEVRRLNALTPERPVWSSGETIAQTERLAAVFDALAATEVMAQAPSLVEEGGRYRQGTGLSVFIYGANLHHGGQPLDRGGALVQVQADGSVNVAIGVTEMGQGALTAARAIAATALGADEERIRITEVDTDMVADSGPTVASRATLVGGRAICDAAEQLQTRLTPLAAELLKVPDPDGVVLVAGGFESPDGKSRVAFEQVAGLLYARRENPSAVGWYRSEPRDYDAQTGQGQAYMFYSFGAHATRVRVDTWTGKLEVLSITAIHDVGRVIHATAIEGQVEGGAVQAMGWACMENLTLQEGKLMNPSFADYLIPTAVDAPPVNMVFLEDPEPLGPFGARGIGEPSFIPGAAAIANAVAAALGRTITELPLIPERVLDMLSKE
jgi:CO/xanthine dehydrogenase Mo-binding subunit